MKGIEQLEQECRHYAGQSLRSWLKEAYWEWTGSTALLGEMLGIGEHRTCNILKSFEIGLRGRGGVCYAQKPAKEKLSRDYYTRGMTVRQMGEKYGVSHQTVCNWLSADRIRMRWNHRRKNSELPA
jgi:hypothetical protein